ncbi:MAG: ATP-binding protein, partial [Defluviitaleaceae bacterium]|nr:ATP-binding protein [Defluviitaleaceae bacterium]
METGTLSIHSENLLPIIKKWLYSDADIFVREMVSNAADAITKLKKLADIGEAPSVSKDEKYAVRCRTDKENKTIVFEDNGIGMTADEIKEYINQIAFSGANEFLEKYKDKMDKDNEIIGHFGLGFYSSFMVAERVQIDSLSYKEGAEASRWVCDGGIEYEMTASDKTSRGTTVTLYINEESKEFLEEYKLRS